jgi:hypothetical protein
MVSNQQSYSVLAVSLLTTGLSLNKEHYLLLALNKNDHTDILGTTLSKSSFTINQSTTTRT